MVRITPLSGESRLSPPPQVLIQMEPSSGAYDLPVFGLGGSTDAKVLDHQAGMECTVSLMTALLHGANIVHDVGFMDSGLQGSLQLQVMAVAADGKVDPAEHEMLVRIARRLGLHEHHVAQLEALLRAGTAGPRPRGAPPPRDRLMDAYAALGVAADATPAEIAGPAELEVKTVEMLLALNVAEVRLDAPVGEGEDSQLIDRFLVDESNIEEAVDATILKEHVTLALQSIRPRDARVLRLYYGLQGESEHTLEQIGQLLGVTRERVRQLRDRARTRRRSRPPDRSQRAGRAARSRRSRPPR